MSPVAIAFLSLFALLVVWLLTSFHFRVIWSETSRVIAFRWLFVTIGTDLKRKRFQLSLFGLRVFSRATDRRKPKKKKKQKPKKKKKKKRKRGRFSIRQLWRERDLIVEVIRIAFRFIVNLIRRIRIDRLHVEAQIATPDPAWTGFLYGTLAGITYPLNAAVPSISLAVRPDFESDRPTVNGELAIHLRLIHPVGGVIRLLFALPKWRLIRVLWKNRRRKSKIKEKQKGG
ncbi:MAG: DUF2953 domain-containing protein [Candidatus Bipolaricaulia bacterium]